MRDWHDQLDDGERKALERRTMPKWTEPMLATLTEDRFSSPDWIFERKFDGERCLVFKHGRRLHIRSRNRQDLNDTYPELVEALKEQECGHFIADGEIVAFKGKITSFSRLQGRIGIHDPEEARASGIKVWLYLFDLLYLDDSDITDLPLRTRKKLLRDVLSYRDPLRFTSHHNEHGEKWYRRACEKGWEGVIAKRADAPYAHSRSRQWLKFKCVHQQELVIAGYTDPKGSRTGLGALLLGYYEDDDLRYAGKVGTGFDERTLQDLGEKLRRRTSEECPYAEEPDAGSDVHWVAPKLVAEIGFTEWTRDGRLRHPRFLGLRDDKPAHKVVREEPS